MPSRSRSHASLLARRLALIGALLAGVVGMSGAMAVVRAADGDVVVLTADGTVDNVMAGYLADGVSNAAAAGAPAVVMRLEHPGRQPRRDAQDRRARSSRRRPRHRLGHAQRRPGGERRHVHHDSPRNLALDGARDEHRRRVARRQQRRRHHGHRRREGDERRDRQRSRRSRRRAAGRSLGGVARCPRSEVLLGERGGRRGRGRRRSPRRSTTCSARPNGGGRRAGHDHDPGARGRRASTSRT